MSSASAPLVSGPLATIQMASSVSAVTSSRRSSISGSAEMAAVTSSAKTVAIHGEGVPARNAGGLRGAQQQRIQAAQFLFEQPGRGGFGLALQRVAAHQFGEAIGLVRGGGPHRAHFVQHARNSAARDLPRGFACRRVRRR